jgi:hypothetical protein
MSALVEFVCVLEIYWVHYSRSQVAFESSYFKHSCATCAVINISFLSAFAQ